jgi:hypothetical protein
MFIPTTLALPSLTTHSQMRNPKHVCPKHPSYLLWQCAECNPWNAMCRSHGAPKMRKFCGGCCGPLMCAKHSFVPIRRAFCTLCPGKHRCTKHNEIPVLRKHCFDCAMLAGDLGRMERITRRRRKERLGRVAKRRYALRPALEPCVVCKKWFRTHKGLMQHLKRVHRPRTM